MCAGPKTELEENKFSNVWKAIQDNAVVLNELNKQMNFDSFRNDLRFNDLLKRMNLPESIWEKMNK